MSIVQMTAVAADAIGAQPSQPASKPRLKDRKSQAREAAKAEAEAAGREAASGELEAADERLVIQPGVQAGLFIYTILDRSTGRVMAKIPREEVEAIARRPDYRAGQVIDTKI